MHRDQQRSALADAYRAEQVLDEQRSELAIEETDLRELQRSALHAEQLDINRLLESQRYEMILRANEQHLARQSQQLAAEVERRRLAVVEADRSVRVLDLLEERQRREHSRQQQRREVKQLDEVAVTQQIGNQSARA
jgi:flagellar export protein FliJ